MILICASTQEPSDALKELAEEDSPYGRSCLSFIHSNAIANIAATAGEDANSRQLAMERHIIQVRFAMKLPHSFELVPLSKAFQLFYIPLALEANIRASALEGLLRYSPILLACMQSHYVAPLQRLVQCRRRRKAALRRKRFIRSSSI